MAVQAFDLVVIGGGPAGISGANTAGIFKRVALVGKLHEVGGALSQPTAGRLRCGYPHRYALELQL